MLRRETKKANERTLLDIEEDRRIELQNELIQIERNENILKQHDTIRRNFNI